MMSYRLTNANDDVIFALDGEEYVLRSHPYEPCLYICRNAEVVRILHNAFDVDGLVRTFEAGEAVTAPDGKQYDGESFCKVLAAALRDDRYEMNWTFAARLVK